MTKQHKIAGLFLVTIGLYVSLYSFIKLDVGTIGKPGSGFFTLVCGLGIFIMAAIWLISGLRVKTEEQSLWEGKGWLLPLLAVAVTFVYALLIVRLGYILSTAVFIVLWQIIIAKGKRRTIILFAVIGTVSMYVIFELLLSVPLPNGLLRF